MIKFNKIQKLIIALAIIFTAALPICIQASMQQPIRILQLTDLHLLKDQTSAMPSINIKPYDSLQQVMRLVDESNQKQTPSLMVLTGDISQDHTEKSHQLAKQFFTNLPHPIIATMGNHDAPSIFTKFFNDPRDSANKIIHLGNWVILLVNSNWPEHVGGKLSEDELSFLNNALAAERNKHVIIFMHHHVLPVGSAWIDTIGVSNATDFLNIIDRYTNIKAIICGHVHQETSSERNKVKYFTTPATSWQFLTKSPEYKLDSLMPGFRWLDLYEDGSLSTEVVRIPYNPVFIPNLDNTGY